jgi:helix-turn-helix protein
VKDARLIRGTIVERLEVGVTLDPFLSLKAAAAYTSLSSRTLRSYIELPPGEALPAYRPPAGHGGAGGKILLRRSELDAWLAQYRTRGRPSLVKAMQALGMLSTTETANSY